MNIKYIDEAYIPKKNIKSEKRKINTPAPSECLIDVYLLNSTPDGSGMIEKNINNIIKLIRNMRDGETIIIIKTKITESKYDQLSVFSTGL